MKKNNYENMMSIAINKSLLKEYNTTSGRTVYLDKDSEFQIKLFNPTTKTIGADVYVNGTYLGSSIIIKPGQLIWLERYLDEARKFKFDTYAIDGASEAVKNAIRNNGKIEVKFYNTKDVKPRTNLVFTSARTYPDITYYSTCDNSGINGTYNVSSVTTGYAGEPANAATCTYAADSNISNLTASSAATTAYYSTSISSDGALGFSDDSLSLCASSCGSGHSRGFSGAMRKTALDGGKRTNINGDIQTETGRVEKGSYSTQSFSDVDVDMEYWPFKTEAVMLLPKSQKPVFKEDLAKIYCPNCGRKLKTKFKFCPFCGEKL